MADLIAKLITDKIKTSEFLEEIKQIYCPPNRMSNIMLLIGEKVRDDPCHFHTTTWRSMFHISYCLLTSCPNTKAMILARREYVEDLADYKK